MMSARARRRAGAVFSAVALLMFATGGAPGQVTAIGSAHPGGVSLASVDEAIALGLERSPVLRGAEAKRRGSLGERLQAGSPPNPEANVEVENFGTGELRGFRQAEITMGLSQKIETAGKWVTRVRVADAGVVISERESAIARRDLIRDIRKTYVEVVAAVRTEAIEGERANLAREVVRVARERAAAGADPAIQVRKAEIAQSTAEIALERARREYGSALRELAVLLSQSSVQLAAGQPWFEDIGPPPPGARPVEGDRRVEAGPEWTKWDAEIARSRAAFELERANAYPDVTVGAGVRRFRDSDDTAFVLGASIPIPVFNRNRGAKEKAAQDIVRSEAEAQQAWSNLRRGLADAEAKLLAAWHEADTLRRQVLPRAEEAFAFARDGYRAGKYPFLEVLDAQRTFAETRGRIIEVLRDLHIQRAEVERLIGADRFNGAAPQSVTPTR